MTNQISIAIAGNIGGPQGLQGRQDPQSLQLQQMMQFMQGLMAGQMLSQLLGGGGQQGCPCSRNQSPNFGMNGINGNALGGAPFAATPFPSLATGGFSPGMNGNALMSGLPSLAFSGGAAMQAAQMQMLHSDQQQAMTIGTVGGGFPSGYMGLPGSFSNNLGMFLG